MFCAKCGAPNEEDAGYCSNCGAALHPEQITEAMAAPEAEQAEAGAGAAQQQAAPSAPEAGVHPALPAPPEGGSSATPALPSEPPSSPAPPARIAEVPTSGMAIASLALGVAGWTFLPVLGSVLAIILGYMARSDIRRRPDQVAGEGIAMAGIVLGWIAVILALLAVLFVVPMGLCAVWSVFGW